MDVASLGNGEQKRQDQTRPDQMERGRDTVVVIVATAVLVLFVVYRKESNQPAKQKKKQNEEAEEIEKKKRRKPAKAMECGPIQYVPLRGRVWTW